MPSPVTFPFFLEQVKFYQMTLHEQAKYLLLFVTEVVKLRRDGMELSIIVQRLKSIVPGYEGRTDLLEILGSSFPKDTDIISDTRKDGTAVYKIHEFRVQALLNKLYDGLRVFISYKSDFSEEARRIRDILVSVGVSPVLDIHDLDVGNIHDWIRRNIKDSCLAVFLITPQFTCDNWIRIEINAARERERQLPDRFAILPIVISVEGQAEPTVPEELGGDYGDRFYRKVMACSAGRKILIDFEIVDYIVRAMPVCIGLTRWKKIREEYESGAQL